MAKKSSSDFITLKPIPGGRYDTWLKKKKTKKAKIPKDPDKFIDIFVDEFGMDKVADMTEVNIADYVYEKGINHSVNMNVGRNIPWMEDGLKPIERRLLYTLYTEGIIRNKMEKVISITGSVVKRFHPHGDASVADTLYRLGRSRSMMIPYIEPGGNFGNMETMKPAAPRYASASLAQYAVDCFFSEMGAKYPIFDVKDNYHYSEKEPIYLTSRYPNILMQWNLGIGKGASAWLGAFNSKDIFNTALKMLDDPKCKVEIYPDTPIPVTITNKKDLKHCFDMQTFSVRMRGQYKIVTDKKRDERGKIVDKYTIVFTSLPINVTGAVVRNEIIKIKEEDVKKPKSSQRLPEVLNIEVAVTDRTPGGIEFIVEYERGYDPNALAEKLFRSTSLGITAGVRYTLISDNQPFEFTPRQILTRWIDQRYDQKRRYYHQLALKAARDRAEYEASCILLESGNIDKAIAIIKKSKDDADTIKALMKTFGFTEFQAAIVIRLQLRNLNKVNIDDLKMKRDKAIADYKKYRKLLSDETAIKEAIREELKDGLKKYGKDRLAALTNLEPGGQTGDPEGTKKIYWNSEGFMTASTEDDQKALRGRLDKTTTMVEVKNTDKILIVGDSGLIKLLDGYAFNATTATISFAQVAFPNVVGLIPITKDLTHLALVTSMGYGKVIELDDVLKSTKSKIINLPVEDKLAGAVPINGKHNGLIVMAADDRMYYTKLEDFPVLKRHALGNRIIKVYPCTIHHAFFMAGPADYIMIYGEFGYVKVVDARLLKFNKRKAAYIDLNGKEIMGAIPIDPQHMPYIYYDEIGREEFNIEVGTMVKFIQKDGSCNTKFRIGTSISTPVKALKKGRNEYYQIEVTK